MRRVLAVAVVVALVGAAVSANLLSTGDVAAAEKRGACPGKFGALRLSSGSLDEENANKHELKCIYASKDFSRNVVVRVSWLTRTASPAWMTDLEPTYCLRTDEDYVGPGQHGDNTRWGSVFPHAGELYVTAGYLATEKGPAVERIKDFGRQLASRHAGLAATCPGVVDPASGVDGSLSGTADPPDEDAEQAAADPSVSETTIVLSGGPDAEPPAVGTTIVVPEDDRHRIVIGGPDGKVIREEHLGDRASVAGYGPLVTDADGNWSVLVTVDVETDPQPTTPPSAEPVLTPDAAATPEPAPTPMADGTGADPTASPTTPKPTEGPAAEPPPDSPSATSESPASATPVPAPELIGLPAGIAAIVAELPPDGAGAVRNVSDHVAVLGEMLEVEQRGTVQIPPADIGSLRELLPDLVEEVWLTDGSVVVSTTSPMIGSILVKPVIGEDGLISVELSQYQIATLHPVVRALVAALNGYVAERGGRFSEVTVTPEGLSVTAVGSTQE